LTALRKYSIRSPGGSEYPPVGSWENPGYSVTITDEEAQEARAACEAREEEKRLKKLIANASKPRDESDTNTSDKGPITPGLSNPFTDDANVLPEAEKWRKAASTVK
jgi:hypothetical protein